MTNETPAIPPAKVAKKNRGTGRRKPYRRTLKNFLLDRKLQLRYIITITAVSAVIAGVLGFLIWRQGSETTDDVVANIARTYADDAALSDDVASDLSESDDKLIWQMAGFGAGLALILSLFLLILTHKVAGPLFKLSMHFDDLALGKFKEVRSLRRFDMLHGFHSKFEHTHAAMRTALVDDIAAMEAVLTAAGDAGHGASASDPGVAEAMKALSAHIDERKTSLI